MTSRHSKFMHIFPFFSKNIKNVKIEHVNLEDDEAELRGLNLKKTLLNTKDCPVYINNKKVEGNVYYWKITNEGIFDTFENAINLTERGLK
ncbi:uncharacterized protein VNE69_01391 [Vairimorpha necatrix]|uniref:Uncharacterized protein n=1 Tax=Vairimorpha necatrix TaxID=6039 RepID=A0AAX4J946_9MICR